MLAKHDKCVFNGNGYDPEWPDEAVKRGVWRIDAGCDAINELDSAKNVELFEKMGIFSARECEARKSVLLGHYIGSVEMEALTMIDMINQHVIPSVKRADLGNPGKLNDAVKTLKGAIASIHAAAESDEHKAAQLARKMRLETMVSIRDSSMNSKADARRKIGLSRRTQSFSSSTLTRSLITCSPAL